MLSCRTLVKKTTIIANNKLIVLGGPRCVCMMSSNFVPEMISSAVVISCKRFINKPNLLNMASNFCRIKSCEDEDGSEQVSVSCRQLLVIGRSLEDEEIGSHFVSLHPFNRLRIRNVIQNDVSIDDSTIHAVAVVLIRDNYNNRFQWHHHVILWRECEISEELYRIWYYYHGGWIH